jgi:hypothetical protein
VALVDAAHQVDAVLGAEGRRAGAAQLRDGRDAAVGSLLVAAEGEGLDLMVGGR